MNTPIAKYTFFLFIAITLILVAEKSISKPEINNTTGHFQITLQVQDSIILYRIETKGGNIFIGEIIEQNAEQLILKTENFGTITISKMDLIRISIIRNDRIIDNTYWVDHMQSTRYFWQPSGYGLKKGEGYSQNIWVLFNQFSYGVSDNFLIGGGIIPLFLFAGTPTPVWLTPKVSIPIKADKLNLGAGGLFATVLGEQDMNFGILYGTLTVGSKDKNVSFGAGYGYAGGNWATSPTFSFSILHRTSSKGYFLSENYFIGTSESFGILAMIGGRRIIGQRSGLDFGIVLPISPDQDIFLAIPWLGITIPFGSNP